MLTINPKIFKAYDIRGIYKQDFDKYLAYLLALNFVKLRKNDSDYQGQELKIAIASDMRLSSPDLKKYLIKGLLEAGVKVVDLGLVSTPTFYFAVGKHKLDGGIMISASHNPKEWNGFKLVRKNSVPISGDTGIDFLKTKILKEAEYFNPESINKLKDNENNAKKNIQILSTALEEKIDFSFNLVNALEIRNFKIVADPANSMGILYLEKLFSKLNQCEFIPINFILDGNFPAHEADPLKEKNLQELKNKVIELGADLGIATDGDGDRVFFVNNLGQVIEPAIIRGLLAKIFLKDNPGAKIGYDVRPGKITEDLIIENGGEPVITRVGHSLIKEQMIKENIYFAGESSGHFYLNTEMGCFEYPALVILKLLHYFSQINLPISEYLKQYKKYFASGEINSEVADKNLVFENLKEVFSKDCNKMSDLDGLSFYFNDFWFNVRGSNTEEKVRLNLEGVNPEIVKLKTEEILKIINQE